MKEPKMLRKIAVNLIIAILGLLGLFFIVPKILVFFMPFVIGWIIAMIANPLVRFLDKRMKIVRKHGSAIIIIAAITAVVLGLYFGGVWIFKEISSLLMDLSQIYEQFEETLQQASNSLSGLYEKFPVQVRDIIDAIIINMDQYITDFLSGIEVPTIQDAGSLAKNVAEILFMSIITILSSYFFIAERDELVQTFRTITPDSILDKYDMIIVNFKRAISGYFKAQFKIMLILIAIMFIGFRLLSINYAFFLSIGVAILDFLPFFGTGAILWPWAFINLLSKDYIGAIALLVIYLICQVTKQILQPKMVGDSIGISPLTTLIFMYIGYKIKGVIGIIIGIPVGMILVNFYQNGVFSGVISGLKTLIKEINDYRK